MHRRNPLWIRISRIATLAIMMVIAVPTTAHARHVDNMFPTANYNGCTTGVFAKYCQTDNDLVNVYTELSINNDTVWNVSRVLSLEFDPTDLNVAWVQTPSYSGSFETDIIYKRAQPPGGSAGFAYCDDAISATKCDQHYVVFRDASVPDVVICHETGHAVGLTHGQQAAPKLADNDPSLWCMAGTAPNLGHNVEWINATYPN